MPVKFTKWSLSELPLPFVGRGWPKAGEGRQPAERGLGVLRSLASISNKQSTENQELLSLAKRRYMTYANKNRTRITMTSLSYRLRVGFCS
jgi:hypothetical protein